MEDLNQLIRNAASGDEEAVQTLLKLYQENKIPVEFNAEAHIFLKAQKNHQAIYLRGLFYQLGYGTKQNLEMSFLFMRDAAAKGNAKAIYEVGHHFLEGWGVSQNYANAFEWLNTAASSPHYNPDAMFQLGVMYERGFFVKQDLPKAREWYSKAAEKGQLAAQEKMKGAL